MRSFFFALLSVFILIPGYAQDRDWTLYPNNSSVATSDSVKKELNYNNQSGEVTLIQDKRIDSITSILARDPFIYGYTVQLEVSQQKSIIKNARYKFLKKFPNDQLEEAYKAPNNYLYGGRFYDRLTAYAFKNDVRSYFPDAIVIRRKIDLPVRQEIIKEITPQQDSTSTGN